MDGSGERPRRAQSSTERDLEGLKALKERTAAVPVAVPEDFAPIDTEVMRDLGASQQQLRAARAERFPDHVEHLEHVEERVDELHKFTRTVADVQREHGERLGRVEVAIAGVSGQLSILPQVVNTLQTTVATMQQREADRDRARLEGETDENKNRRARFTKVVSGVVGLITSGAFLHWIVGKL